MMRSSGHADLPLHTGTVPKWLSDRMMAMGTLIMESIVSECGTEEVLVRLSDPLWFQSLGAVMGMDWHSSGITTSVMYALKRGLNPRAKDLGIYICGGRGKYSRQTPEELFFIAESEGLDGDSLVRDSRLCAKVDNNAVQDGFQLYQHNFVLARDGKWAVVQQGMNPRTKTARRYHWCSSSLRSFVEEPHAAVVGENRGKILNLTDKQASKSRASILDMANENPERILREIRLASYGTGLASCDEPVSNVVQGELFPELVKPISENNANLLVDFGGRSFSMPARHDVQKTDVDLKRLGAVLATAYESQPQNFEELLLTKGLGPRTLQSLTLVSEVIYGTPSRFTDPARFSFAHGGKDGHPFPVPIRIFDESIRVLQEGIEKSKLGYKEKTECIKRLHRTALQIERNCSPQADFEKAVQYERQNSKTWDGRTI